MPSLDSFTSLLGRDCSSGTATSITHSNKYPYDRPTESTAGRVSASTPSQTSLGHSHPKSPSGVMQTINTMIEQLRQMTGARHLWEVAVKRNGMTTSLALLGGVLLADTILYPGGKMHRERQVLQAHLTAPNASNSSISISSSVPSSSSSPGLSSTAAGTPAHA